MRTLIIFCFLLLAGCSTTGTESSSDNSGENTEVASADAPKTKKICKREVPTGSHRTIVTCRTVEQVAKEQQEARQLRNRPGSLGAAPIGGN